MFKFKNLTARNFMSIGNVTQTINFENDDLTLVLGENLDLGGEDGGAKNGVGKCLSPDTIVRIRNKHTGEITSMTVKELHDMAKTCATKPKK